MWCQCWYHMTLMSSSISPVYLLVKYDQNEMQHDFFSHLTLLALPSGLCDANGIVNRTTVFIRSRQVKLCARVFCHLMPLMLVSVIVSHDANSVINGTISLVRSRLSEWYATWIFWLCDDTGSNISSMWCQQHHQWYCCICLVKIIKMRCNTATTVGISWCQWHQK